MREAQRAPFSDAVFGPLPPPATTEFKIYRRLMMKHFYAALCAMALVCLVSSLRPAHAQTPAVATKTAATFSYDISEEATIDGTASAILATPSVGMIPGSHLLITTLSGPVDVSLGVFAFRGKGALSVTVGQQVEVTGVMKTLRDKRVFLARTIKVGDQIYAIRNQHGIPVSPQARERAGQENPRKGETQ